MRIFQASRGTHLWALSLFASLGACATIPKDVARTARADLDCPRVEVSELADGRYGAYGCGRGAVYAEICEGPACRVGRLRHGHEAAVAAPNQPAPQASAPREIIPPPPPEPREVIPAPAPEPREIIPAPPPGSANAPTDNNQTTADQNQTTSSTQTVPAPAPAPVPLSQGDLSPPYETTVPATPIQQKVTQTPPEPLVETRPVAPAPTYVWVHGYWWWGPTAWVWVPGYWCPPVVGYAYMPGYWYWSVGYWWYWPGGWGYPGSRVVVYQVAPRPRNVVQVQSFRPRNVVHATPAPSTTPSRGVVTSRPVAPPSTRAFTPRPSPILRYPTPRAVSPATSIRNNAYGGLRTAPSTFAAPARSFAVPRRTSPGSVGRVVTPAPRAVSPSSPAVRSSVRATPSAGMRPSVQRSQVPRSFNMRPAPTRSAPPSRRR